jgi:hypothetical protein
VKKQPVRFCDRCKTEPAKKGGEYCPKCQGIIDHENKMATLNTTDFKSTRNWLNSWAEK